MEIKTSISRNSQASLHSHIAANNKSDLLKYKARPKTQSCTLPSTVCHGMHTWDCTCTHMITTIHINKADPKTPMPLLNSYTWGVSKVIVFLSLVASNSSSDNIKPHKTGKLSLAGAQIHRHLQFD